MNLLKNIARDALGSYSSSSSSSKSLEDWYITAERAEGVKDSDRFSKSDPYLKINFGGKSVRTRTINNDRSPAWNETFHFQLSPDKLNDIQIKLMDDDIGLDDSIGVATVSRGDLPLTSGEDKLIKVPVLRKGQMTGLVYLRIKRISANSSLPSQSHGVSSSTSQFGQQQQQYPQSNFSRQQQQQYPQSNFSQQQQQYPQSNFSQQQQYPQSNFSQQQQYPQSNLSQQQQYPQSNFSQQQQYPQSNFSQQHQQPMSYNHQPSYQSQYPGQGPMMNQPQQQQQQQPQQQQYMGMSGSQQPQGYCNNPPNNNFDQQRRY